MLIALGGVLLVLGIALCVFDEDDAFDGDLCLMSLALLAGTFALWPPSVVARMELSQPTVSSPLLADPPFPPPEA